ncbi:hypothetical protein FPV67DRAFT_1664340 [Lyophyllum atratum]|nr:hypothetical protein FPV67DRAFT_1664340 [Lyophyllum atratum]
MDIDSDFITTAPFPAFQPPPRQDWYYVGYLIGWIISRTQDEFKGLLQQTLPFLFELSTVLERRNELTRRILRILTLMEWMTIFDPRELLGPWNLEGDGEEETGKGRGKIVSVDLGQMAPIRGAHYIQADFLSPGTDSLIHHALSAKGDNPDGED